MATSRFTETGLGHDQGWAAVPDSAGRSTAVSIHARATSSAQRSASERVGNRVVVVEYRGGRRDQPSFVLAAITTRGDQAVLLMQYDAGSMRYPL